MILRLLLSFDSVSRKSGCVAHERKRKLGGRDVFQVGKMPSRNIKQCDVRIDIMEADIFEHEDEEVDV